MKNKIAPKARQILAAFLSLLGISPSVGGTFETRKDGLHRVYIYEVPVTAAQADAMDPNEINGLLTAYLKFNNTVPPRLRFHPYGVVIGICPCGCCGTLCISIYR